MKVELKLNNEGIDSASEIAASFLVSTGATEREVMAGRLSFENALLFL